MAAVVLALFAGVLTIAAPALVFMAPIPRARARGARRWRRELGGGVRQHPGSNNCVEGGAFLLFIH